MDLLPIHGSGATRPIVLERKVGKFTRNLSTGVFQGLQIGRQHVDVARLNIHPVLLPTSIVVTIKTVKPVLHL